MIVDDAASGLPHPLGDESSSIRHRRPADLAGVLGAVAPLRHGRAEQLKRPRRGVRGSDPDCCESERRDARPDRGPPRVHRRARLVELAVLREHRRHGIRRTHPHEPVGSAHGGHGPRSDGRRIDCWRADFQVHRIVGAGTRYEPNSDPEETNSKSPATTQVAAGLGDGGGRIRTFEDRSRQIYSLASLDLSKSPVTTERPI